MDITSEPLTRRTFLKGLAAGVAAVALGACGGTTQRAGVIQGGKLELVWMVRNSPQENPWERDIVKPAFEKANPNIRINIISLNQDDIAVKRQTILAANEPLHVWSPNWGGDGFGSDRARGLLQNLSPLIKKTNFDMSIFNPSVRDIYKVNGNYYGLPILTIGSYVFYNQKLFDAANEPYPTNDWNDKSWTWDKFVEVAQRLTKNYGDLSNGQYGASLSIIDGNLESPPRSWGWDPFPDSAYTTGFADAVHVYNERVYAAYQAQQDIIYKYKASPDASIQTALSNFGGPFASGKVAMEIQGGWDIWVMKAQIDDPDGFCFGVAPLPWGTPDAVKRSIIFTDPWSMTSGLREDFRDAAWKLLQFNVSEPMARAYMKKVGAPPTQTRLLQEYYKEFEKCMKPADLAKAFEGGLKYGKESSNHLVVKWDELNQIWANNFAPFLTTPSMTAKELMAKVGPQTTNKLQQIKQQYSALAQKNR